MFSNPTVDQFKAFFTRDFPYGAASNVVNDQDITNAIFAASVNINPGLFATQAEYTLAYLLLTAHFLCQNLQASSQGIAGQYNWLTSSKSVGSVSQGFSIPDYIASRPAFAYLVTTRYGAQYVSMVFPRLVGNMFTTPRCTSP